MIRSAVLVAWIVAVTAACSFDTTSLVGPNTGGDGSVDIVNCGNTTTDVRNCGSCGNDCSQLPHVVPTMVSCQNGICMVPIIACATGWAHCTLDPPGSTGCESDIAQNTQCGSCNNACASSDTCGRGPDNLYACQVGCTATQCGTACTDLRNDPNNCGHCGTSCAFGEVCCAGACSDVSSDARNCGGCGMPCPGGMGCMLGACQPCAGSVCSGVCVDTMTDEANCGGCGTPCTAAQRCCGGHCVDAASDPNNCGACGNICAPFRPVCCTGGCVNTRADPLNCGMCGHACAGTNACVGGNCP